MIILALMLAARHLPLSAPAAARSALKAGRTRLTALVVPTTSRRGCTKATACKLLAGTIKLAQEPFQQGVSSPGPSTLQKWQLLPKPLTKEAKIRISALKTNYNSKTQCAGFRPQNLQKESMNIAIVRTLRCEEVLLLIKVESEVGC